MMDNFVVAGTVLLALVFFGLWLRAARQLREGWGSRSLLRRELDMAKEESARASDERLWLDIAGQASQEMLIGVDRQLKVRSANPAALQDFGPVPPQASLITYMRSLDLEELAREALESRSAETLERVVRFGRQPFRARVVPAPDGLGIALMDVAEMERLGRARQDMVANLSHELRTPLTSLRLLADTLQVPVGQDPATARELAAKISAEVDTLAQMTREMLDLAAIESGRQVIRLAPATLAGIVAGAVERVEDQARRRGIRIDSSVPPELKILADPDQAARAVGNVLHNALKFSPQGGTVALSAQAEADGEHITLSVADEGPGIPPDEIERVFERFFRGDRSRGTPGTGLGLAIARHILRAHGGETWAQDRQPPQRGAVFFLRFRSAASP
jgi:two-component system phosphate regulon sensor histidine kinase PhoR